MASTRKTISEDVTGEAVDYGGEFEDELSEEEYSYDEEMDNNNSGLETESEESEGLENQTMNATQELGKRKRGLGPKLDQIRQDMGPQKRLNHGFFPEPDTSDGTYRVLHRVICRASTHHIFKLFEDVPVRGSVGHLSGFEPLRHEEDYVTKYPSLAFIVIKEHYCKPEEAESVMWETASAGFSRSSHHFSQNGSIRIISEDLKKSMDAVSTAYIYGSQHQDICPPYLWIFHHRSSLRSSARKQASTRANNINTLLDYAIGRYGELYARADQYLREGCVDKDSLPFLFCPNSLVVSRMQSTRTYDRKPVMRAFVLQKWPFFRGDHVQLQGWYYKHNSTQCTRAVRSQDLKIPVSKETIQSMHTFPFKFAYGTERSSLVDRGRQYWSYRTTHNVCYNGWDDQEKMLLSDARLMIDYRTYRQLHSSSSYWKENLKIQEHDRWPAALEHDRNLTEEYYAMFPEVLHAFLLKEKQWITIRIEQISPIDWNSQAFERLVLPENTKDLIKSLVLVRTTEIGESKGLSLAGKRKDLIAGKGNGLIMLLHGAPGTGKTLTAESVAEIAKRPLYNVTCGDIGTNPEEVEKYLKAVLFLGKTWNCILLLDEADVFLEERSLSDLSRNSLVSVFLRTLEYYDGILILTSNRVGTFDEAFSSRIQVSLHFSLLDRPSRRKIWKNFLDMMREDEEEMDYLDLISRLDEISDIEMNGRQIRNVLTTARQLAMYKMVTLEWDHVQRAIRSVADFKRYMQTVHGHTEEQNARDEKLR